MVKGVSRVVNVRRLRIAAVLLLSLFLGFAPAADALQLFSVDQEIAIGQDMAEQMEAEYGLYHDRHWGPLVEQIGRSIVPYSRRPDLPYQFRILDSDQINAVAIPGGFVYVYRGLLDAVNDNNELAAVIAHEIAHVANRHSMRRLERNLGIQLGLTFVFRLLLRNEPSVGAWQQVSNVGVHLLNQGYSREDEFDADLTGVKMMTAAGYDPYGMIRFFQTLQDMHRREPSRLEVFFSTHPPHSDRIDQVQTWIDQEYHGR